MKNRLFYLGKINIAKVVVLGYIFIMSLFVGGTVVKAEDPTVTILASTYKGNATGATAYNSQVINNIAYIQGTGMSGQDGIVSNLTKPTRILMITLPLLYGNKVSHHLQELSSKTMTDGI